MKGGRAVPAKSSKIRFQKEATADLMASFCMADLGSFVISNKCGGRKAEAEETGTFLSLAQFSINISSHSTDKATFLHFMTICSQTYKVWCIKKLMVLLPNKKMYFNLVIATSQSYMQTKYREIYRILYSYNH